jgi:hypothetical protein
MLLCADAASAAVLLTLLIATLLVTEWVCADSLALDIVTVPEIEPAGVIDVL